MRSLVHGSLRVIERNAYSGLRGRANKAGRTIPSNASEVYKVLYKQHSDLERRHSDHEKKCDARQLDMHKKLDHVEKVVYIGVGVMLVIDTIALILGPSIIKSF